jgi:hypothetical protein
VSDLAGANELGSVSLLAKSYMLTREGVLVTVSNNSSTELIFNDYFRVEKKVGRKWRQVPYIINDVTWNAIKYPVGRGVADSERQWLVNWENLYGSLADGDYRIIKDARASVGRYWFTSEFSINSDKLLPQLNLGYAAFGEKRKAVGRPGTVIWSWPGGEGQMGAYNADSLHPLNIDYFRDNSNGTLLEISDDSKEATLTFSKAPKSVTVERFDGLYASSASGQFPEPEAVEMVDGKIPLELTENGFVYSVHAYFDQGDIHYGFKVALSQHHNFKRS